MSAALMRRAAESLPGGLTRHLGHHPPYPVVIERAEGVRLWDVDGNAYVDLNYNGLSLIHGHAFAPVREALSAVLPTGWAWLGTSRPQIAFAEAICGRLPGAERVMFTNSGTEAGMLAVKLARRATGRALILKATAAYHGSYADLEAGLYGQGGLPGRTLVAPFNDLGAFEQALAAHAGQIAAVIMEPVICTGAVTPQAPGFLTGVQAAARRAGALFIVDDCLMLRLAPGGSAEAFGLDPDLTMLGKFIGGGLPAGAVCGRAEIMDLLTPERAGGVYHGGSFNGNGLAMVAGRVALEHLTADRIGMMDRQLERLRAALRAKADALGLPLETPGAGSIMGLHFGAAPALAQAFHLACLNNGVHMAPGGLVALATPFTDPVVDEVAAAMGAALEAAASACA